MKQAIIAISNIEAGSLVAFEPKSPSREEADASDAYKQLRNRMKHMPSMFVPNAFCMTSGLTGTRAGTITAKEDRYVAWRSVDGKPFEEKTAHMTGKLAKCFEESNRLQEQIRKSLEAIGYGF